MVFIPASGESDATYSLTSAASALGHTYRLQTTTSLGGTWTDLGDPVLGTGSVLVFAAPYTAAEPSRFYRIHISR
jgi:hypothetical protein